MSTRRTGRIGALALGAFDAIADVANWPVSALLLRACLLLAPPAALLVAAGAGDPPKAAVLVIVVLFSVGFAVAPESGFGLLALTSVVGWWCLVDDDGLHASVLVAAVLLTVAHVAGLLASYGPPGVAVDAAVGRAWIGRASLVLLAAPVVWLLARLVHDHAPDAALWQAGLLVAVLAVAIVAVTLGAGPGARENDHRAAR